jgi:hypothetical protein
LSVGEPRIAVGERRQKNERHLFARRSFFWISHTFLRPAEGRRTRTPYFIRVIRVIRVIRGRFFSAVLCDLRAKS